MTFHLPRAALDLLLHQSYQTPPGGNHVQMAVVLGGTVLLMCEAPAPMCGHLSGASSASAVMGTRVY